MPLSPLLQADSIKETLKTKIIALRQEDRGHEFSTNNETAITQLEKILILLEKPENYSLALNNGLSNHSIADKLERHGIIKRQLADEIRGKSPSKRRTSAMHPHA